MKITFAEDGSAVLDCDATKWQKAKGISLTSSEVEQFLNAALVRGPYANDHEFFVTQAGALGMLEYPKVPDGRGWMLYLVADGLIYWRRRAVKLRDVNTPE